MTVPAALKELEMIEMVRCNNEMYHCHLLPNMVYLT